MMKASLYPLLLQILLTLLLNISTSEGLSSSLQRKGGRTMPMTTTTQPSNDAITINRHFQGDIFVASHCSKSFCDSNGTRGEVIRPGGSNCECQCKTNYPIYREDRKQCVKDFPECMLADFISGSASEKIPFVFMPLPGQLIYPSAEIAISDVDTHGNPVLAPICVVSGVDILEATGWRSFENISGDSFQQPFQLHRNDDKTYLQWLGGDKLRKLLEGRLVLVHLLCKDTIRHTGKQLFSPCVAFRVAGSPGPLLPSSLHVGDGRSSEDDSEGLSFGDYLAIGVCVAFLGIIYIIAIIFFIFMKRKKRRKERLRRQFLKPPSTLPPGLRYKSSVLLGLEAAFVSELQKNARNNGGLHLNHHGISTSLGSTRIDEPVYDITKSKRNEPSDSQESIVLHKNDKLFDGATKQVVGGRSKGKGGGAYEESDNNLDGIFVNTPATHDKENEQGQNSTEFFSKIRFLVRSARAKMKVKYSPGLTDIPEEIQTPKTYKNPAFIEEDSNFRLNKKGHHPFHQYPSSNGGHSFKSFNDVNAKIYKSFRNNKKQQQFRKNEQESSDYSSQEDSLGKRSSSRENCDPLSLDSGVVTNGSVSPTSTTNDHNHGSSDCSSPHNNPETMNESHSNCNETTDDEVVDVASEDTDSSDNDGYFDSLKRPGDVTEKSIVETISPQFKSSYGRKGSVLSPNSSIKKPNSIVPNYIVIPPSGRLEKKSHQESMDLLTKLYDKAVLKIPKVIPSDNESLYSDRSNTIQSIDHDSLDPKNIKKVGGGCHKSIDEDSTYEIVECSQDMSPGVYINNMYSPDTLDGKRKSSIVGEKMILSVSGAPQPTSINDQVFTNKLLISVDYNVKNPDNNVSKNNEKSFDPDTLERVEREPSSSFKGKKYFSKFKKDNHPTAIKSLEPPDLPPKINHHSSPNPLPLPSKSAVPPPPPLPPPLPPYTSSNLEKSPDFKSSTKKNKTPKYHPF
ncbi:uncharacterized protein sha isoform X2 [Lepeophtheirus salmonis]|uniref:uncharacterized protein sha isoform X2 n=1 Tax=Lepeophtheirus salmonis TaxID=72036 RepID=UPI001AEB07EC|nr:uncharacterized protein LOC121119481 isoform X2 [Lepeophtheirus salmonis]